MYYPGVRTFPLSLRVLELNSGKCEAMCLSVTASICDCVFISVCVVQLEQDEDWVNRRLKGFWVFNQYS